MLGVDPGLSGQSQAATQSSNAGKYLFIFILATAAALLAGPNSFVSILSDCQSV